MSSPVNKIAFVHDRQSTSRIGCSMGGRSTAGAVDPVVSLSPLTVPTRHGGLSGSVLKKDSAGTLRPQNGAQNAH
jgi:hypothetical protein